MRSVLFFKSLHSWHLNNAEVKDTSFFSSPFLHSWKSIYDFWLSKNITINGLLLTGSLTDNLSGKVTCIFFVICIMYGIVT